MNVVKSFSLLFSGGFGTDRNFCSVAEGTQDIGAELIRAPIAGTFTWIFLLIGSLVFHASKENGVDFSKFDFVITGDPVKHRLLDLFEVQHP